MACPLPKIHHQLDGSPNQGENCGPCACATGADFGSCGEYRPRVATVRKAMGVPTGPTSIRDSIRAYQSFADEFKARGRKPPRIRAMLFGSWADDAMPALREGHALQLAVNYATLNRIAPKLSGDKRFMGAHMIFAHGLFRRDGVPSVRVWDSLDDHRRPGIPDGPILWPVAVLKECCGDLVAKFADGTRRPIGQGKVAGIIVKRSGEL